MEVHLCSKPPGCPAPVAGVFLPRAGLATRGEGHSPPRGRYSTPLLGGFVQDERFALRGLPFAILLTGIVGVVVGNAEGRMQRQQVRWLL